MPSVTAGYIPPPIFVYIKYVYSPTTLFLYYISQRLFIHPQSMQTPVSSVTVGYIPPPIFEYMEYVLLPTTLCNKISRPKPNAIYTHIFATNTCVICNGGSHPAAIYVVRTIYIPTNNAVSIKYLTKNLIPNGGDTPFYAFGYEIEDFYLTRKKNGRRYVRRVYVYTYIMPI